MPIKECDAKLWFNTKEEQDEYDDKMIASIELKSLEFDDENFSPVFTRERQEHFFSFSDRAKKDIAEYFRFGKMPTEEFIDKYIQVKPNHTFFRSLTSEKFVLGGMLGYFTFREIPLRNFYARCLVMFGFMCKWWDFTKSPWLFWGKNLELGIERDRWSKYDSRCYPQVAAISGSFELPNSKNQAREIKKWKYRQPPHLEYETAASPFDVYRMLISKNTVNKAYWDGTMNQPLARLADPHHKDNLGYMWRS